MNEIEIRDAILELLRKHYKRTNFRFAYLSGDCFYLVAENCAWHRYPWIAKRILDAFPEVRMVQFTGGWTESVYTRETLKWCGYKMKEHKTKEIC